MYRQRLVSTAVSAQGARRLQRALLAYHDFRQHKSGHHLLNVTAELAYWQAQRLKKTHQDLYSHPGYQMGLEFLLTDLYAPASMSQRDDNIDRIFPRMVKWLPDSQLDTFAGLMELNLLTQRLDLELAELLATQNLCATKLSETTYCQALLASNRASERARQIELVAEVGRQLDRYVQNRTLGWLLSISRGPAEMADLTDLHLFLYRGYKAFRQMDDVERLIERLVARETRVLENILNNRPNPFLLTDD